MCSSDLTEPARRFREHASGRGARWFRGTSPRRFLYLEPCPDRAAAQRREAAIKRLKRAEKLALVASAGPLPEPWSRTAPETSP